MSMLTCYEKKLIEKENDAGKRIISAISTSLKR